jgi:hypothetical protein
MIKLLLWSVIFKAACNYLCKFASAELSWTNASIEQLQHYWSRRELCAIHAIAANSEYYLEEWDSLLLKGCPDEALKLCLADTGCRVAKALHSGRWEQLELHMTVDRQGMCSAPLSRRLRFWTSVWSSLPAPRLGMTHHASLVASLRKRSIRDVSFIGDSVSDQIAASLKVLNKEAEADIHVSHRFYLPCGLTDVKAAARSPSVCLTAEWRQCTEEKQAIYILNRTVQAARGPLVVIHPYGAHIWREPRDLSIVDGVAKGIILAARHMKASGGVLIVLEAAAQHFLYDLSSDLKLRDDAGNKSGVYLPREAFHRSRKPGSCCEETDWSEAGNFRNVALKRALFQQDQAWLSYTAWIPLYEATQLLHYGHTDAGSDCTHYAWSTPMLEHVWHHMEAEIERVLSSPP